MSKSTTPNKIDYVMIQRTLAIRKARNNFWSFCHLLYPDFYKADRFYLRDLCDTLQAFYNGDIDKQILIINMPPRHGKTFTARLFVLWVFGQDSTTKFMTASYNQILSSLFAQQTRDGVLVDNENIRKEFFTDIFPNVKIKYGDSAKGFWSLEGSEEKNYLATSPNGTATGIGANYVLVDDIIKDREEAYNDRVKESHWEWYNNTLVQRMEKPRKQILIMTRWASDDLVGKMLEKKKDKCHVITYKAVNENNVMLCEEIMTYSELQDVTANMGADIASANYQQEPIDIKGRLYSSFKTYRELPVDNNGESLFDGVYAYTDTADEGDDYLCCIVFGVYKHEGYVLDVLFTRSPMEETEPMTAKMLHENDVNLARFESNNGGKGYARNVDRHLKDDHENYYTDVTWFHQSKNKKARILTNSTWIMNHIYFPDDWAERWSEFHESMIKYQREGKNKHDDAQDATTGVAETIIGGNL